MKFSEFERRALELFERIPEPFRAGIDKLVIERRSRRHPHVRDYFTLGECVHRPVAFGDGELFSSIHLYHGSFVKIAARDPAFDVAAELEETLLHELRHHLEDRAGIPDLADEDAVEEMNERRRQGLPFAPGFYRLGHELEPGLYEVGGDLFLEVELSGTEFALLAGTVMTVRAFGETFRVHVPEAPESVAFVPADSPLEADDGSAWDLVVAFARKRGLHGFRR